MEFNVCQSYTRDHSLVPNHHTTQFSSYIEMITNPLFMASIASRAAQHGNPQCYGMCIFSCVFCLHFHVFVLVYVFDIFSS